MAGDIDILNIKVQANARTASNQIDSLISKLGSLSNALGGLNTSGLNSLASGVSQLGSAMNAMSGMKTTDFTRVAKGIRSLGNINSVTLQYAANSLSTFVGAMNGVTTVSANASAVGELAKNLSKFGNKNITTAITNMPNLSKALSDLITALSKAPSVSNNVVRLTEAMSKMSSKGSKVATASKNISSGFENFNISARKSSASARSLAYYFGKLYANYFLVIRGAKQLANAVKASMDYIEEYNYFNVTLGKVADEWGKDYAQYGYDNAEAYGDSFKSRLTDTMSKMTGFNVNDDGTLTDTQSKNLGLDMTSLMNYSAGLEQVTNSLGLTGEAGTATAQALTMLAGDMSSFRNVDLSTVMNNFQSGLIGQSRALYKYGIDITNATLANYAMQYGISKSVSEMSQSEKMQLRMIAILDQSRVAYGDLANTINSPSNQVRMLKNNFSALARTIGNIFLPVVAKVLPFINGLVIAIRRLFTWVGSLLGVDLSGIIGSSGTGYSDAMADAADDTEDTSSAIDDVGDSADKAADKVKELKNETMGFDEINKLSDNSDDDSSSGTSGSKSGSGSGSGAPIDLTDALNDALADYQKVWDEAFKNMTDVADGYADNICDFFKTVAKYAEPSVDAVKRLWNEGFKQFREFQWTNLKNFWNDFLVPLGKWTLGTGFPQLVDILNDALKDINYGPLADSLDELYKALEPFAEEIGQGLIDFLRDLSKVAVGAINSMPEYISKFAKALKGLDPDTVEKIGYSLGILFAAVTGTKITGSILSNISELGGTISDLSKIKGLDSVASGLSTFAGVAFKFTAYAGVAVIIAAIAVALDKLGLIDVNWNLLGDGIGSIVKVLGKIGVDIGKGMINFFKGISPLLKVVTFAATSAVGAGLKLIATAIDMIPDGVWEVVASGLTGVVTALLAYKAVTAIPSIIAKVADAVELMYTGLYVAISSNPVGLIVAGIAGVVGAIVGLMQLGGVEDTAVEVSDAVQQITSSAQDACDSLTEQTTQTEATYGATREFADKYFELADNFDNLTDAQKEMLKTYANYIVDDCPQLADSINTVTGQFTGQKDEVYKTIDALEEYAKKAAIQDVLKELYENQVKLKIQIKETGDAYDSTKQQMIDAIKQYSDLCGASKEQHDAEVDEYYSTADLKTIYEGYSDVMYRHGQNTQFTSEQCQQLDANQASLQTSLDETNGTISTATGMLEDLAGGYDSSTSSASATAGQAGKTADAVEQGSADSVNAVESANSKITTSNDNTSTHTKVTLGSILDAAKEKFGQMGQVGEDGGTDLTNNFSSSTSPIPDNLKGLCSNLYNIFVNNGSSAGTDGGNATADNADGALSRLSGICSGAMEDAREAMVDTGGSVGTDTGDTITDNIGNSITRKKGSILSALGGVFKGVTAGLSILSGGTFGFELSGFATGGFPSQGQLFMARESGPEMVGTMGGKTAVANNDQITNGIASAVGPAVYNAIVSASSQTNGNVTVNVHLQGDADGIFKVVKQGAENYTALTGQSAFPV